MNGIYIPGMEIPRCCMDCHYHKSLRDQCILTNRDQRDLWSRPDWCPIVPVPPHGRLIDADAFIEKCKEMADKEDGNQLDALVLLEWFLEQNAPAIIPADRKEDA